MTHLCVAIFVSDLPTAKRDISKAVEHGADVIELRIDRQVFANPPSNWDLEFLIMLAVVPCIVTCRPIWEGGFSKLDDDRRIEMLTGTTGRYVDVELAAADAAIQVETHLKHAGRELILSSHDFIGRPEKLYTLVSDLNDSICNIAKIVWTARTIRDNLEAFEILQTKQKPTIALCMGEAGLISRILAKKFGAFLTFASLDNTVGTAPGQISITDMKRLYRWDSIRPDTKVYGVVGHPIAHSMSPAIHNAAFDHVNYNGIYLPLLVNPGHESFKAFMESFVPFKGLDLSGLSVTIPHKENALHYLKEKGCDVEPLAEQIGAVNTITMDGQKLRGLNTDYAAILDSITERLNITRQQLAGYRIAVIGAGGTGRTAVAALAAMGATVVIYNRTREKADALAKEFTGKTGKVVSAAWEKICDSCCQIYINTTSIGMHPNINQSPFDAKKLGPDVLVFDAVYNPLKTRLLIEAESTGAKTIAGIEMFIRQAAAQFTAWTTLPAPLDLMRHVVEGKLKP